MNKWQLVILAVMILAIICILYITPKYQVLNDDFIKYKKVFDSNSRGESEYDRLMQKYSSPLAPDAYVYRIDWEKIILRSIPICRDVPHTVACKPLFS